MSYWDKIARAAYIKKNSAAGFSKVRLSRAYALWRYQCLERDHYQCVLCHGADQLEVHHIARWVDSPLLRFKKANGATLCKACHVKHHDGSGKVFPAVIVEQLLTALKANGQRFRRLV